VRPARLIVFTAFTAVIAACSSSGSSPSRTPASDPAGLGAHLDTTKNYGNKYADGILPVGDGKYSASAARVGYVYTCSQYAQNLQQGGGGAQARGPWFVRNNTAYDINKKAHVHGAVHWTSNVKVSVSGGKRTITTNDLPTHVTGVFPIQASDPAYSYDRNPNSIKSQSLALSLPSAPTYGDPQCMGGEVGVMLTGVALFNGFDAGGRDAGAWETQDDCNGHPQVSGEYHYHTLSSCIKDVSVHSVIGWALDGFPITGPTVGPNNYLTTADLDVCHGITSSVTVDGKSVTTYHYVMTEDFPYSASCFRAQPVSMTLGSPSGGGGTGGAGPPGGAGQPPPPNNPGGPGGGPVH
jgi:hypothetical protein